MLRKFDSLSCILRAGELQLVLAVAGAGKSTFLRKYARRRPLLRCLYVTFSKALEVEQAAAFANLPHVTVSTLDALAFRATAGRWHEGVVADNLILTAAGQPSTAPLAGTEAGCRGSQLTLFTQP